MPHALDVGRLRERVQEVIDTHLTAQRQVLAPVGDATAPLLDAAGELLGGGKRLRAAFLYWGYRAAGGQDSDALVAAATSMEMFQAAALVHDDVMDDSDTRRGRPAVHRRLAALHAERGWTGDPERFGLAGAVLTGDLCLTWTDELYATSGLPATELARGRAVFDLMRSQLMGGQFLDVLESVLGWDGASIEQRVERARHVARVKSARYTVEHPLLIGAACAGAGPALQRSLSAYGLSLGEAFQQRDDVLGVYGDPLTTGKPAGDDLREGKRTVLVAHTLNRLGAEEGRRFEEGLGRADLPGPELDWMRRRMDEVGAVAQVEQLVDELAADAAAALRAAPGVAEPARGILHELIGIATDRSA